MLTNYFYLSRTVAIQIFRCNPLFIFALPFLFQTTGGLEKCVTRIRNPWRLQWTCRSNKTWSPRKHRRLPARWRRWQRQRRRRCRQRRRCHRRRQWRRNERCILNGRLCASDFSYAIGIYIFIPSPFPSVIIIESSGQCPFTVNRDRDIDQIL